MQNIELASQEKHTDFSTNKIVLKNEQYCPVILINSFVSSFKNTWFKEEEESSTKVQPMKFKLDILNKNWEPASLCLDNALINGTYLTSNTQSSTASDTLIISQTVTKLDKRRIYLRSSVQLINTMKFSIEVSYPAATSNSKSTDYNNSIGSTNWAQYTIKPGQKWSVPLEVMETKSNYVKISPLIGKQQDMQG